MAHKWADWLHNLCNLGGPNHCRGSERQIKLAMANKWVAWLHNPDYLGGHQCFTTGTEISKAAWLHNPCHLGGPQRFKVRDNVNSGPQVCALAT